MFENEPGDVNGHGTACASVIRSIAPDCELYSVRVLSARGTTRGYVFAAGIEWAIDHGMHVVNLSLSSSSDDYFGPLHELADRAAFANVMLVGAMANTRKPTYPSEFASVFSVASHDRDDPLAFDYNPHGPAEWGARGIDVPVAWLDHATLEVTGNSFAASHLVGILALLLGEHPGLTPVPGQGHLELGRRERGGSGRRRALCRAVDVRSVGEMTDRILGVRQTEPHEPTGLRVEGETRWLRRARRAIPRARVTPAARTTSRLTATRSRGTEKGHTRRGKK